MAVLPDVEIILPLEGLIDKEAELAKQRKTLADLERQIGALAGQAAATSRSWRGRRPRSSTQTRAKLAELEAAARRRQRLAASGVIVPMRLPACCVDGSATVLYDRKRALESDSLEGEIGVDQCRASRFPSLPDWKR